VEILSFRYIARKEIIELTLVLKLTLCKFKSKQEQTAAKNLDQLRDAKKKFKKNPQKKFVELNRQNKEIIIFASRNQVQNNKDQN
jgi:hypothetical protein